MAPPVKETVPPLVLVALTPTNVVVEVTVSLASKFSVPTVTAWFVTVPRESLPATGAFEQPICRTLV